MSGGRGGSEFGICFELGRALRRGDVEAFFTVYDKLLPKNAQVSLFAHERSIRLNVPL